MKKTILFVIFVLTTCLFSTIINVPADQPTIQDGINIAVYGDTILVQPGTYVENINYNGKNITVASLFLTTQDTTYISQTIIDGNQNGSVVGFVNGETMDAVLTGFTITNGNSPTSGGGISCVYTSYPRLENLVIIGNSAAYNGGGIICGAYASPSLENVIITGNSAGGAGGGIYCYNHCSPSLKNVLISDNTSQYGGGICCFENSSPNLENVTITDNSASSSGGGIFCYDASPVLINSILWNNSPQEIYIQSGSVTATYSDIQGALWTGDGNINVDPLFVGTGEHPFSLQDLSPCVNAGIPDTTGLNLPEYDLAGNPRVYGGRIDMGAYENQNVAVDANENLIPLVTKLNQNYPNPFNPTTTINYFLKENSKVSLNIYNIKGQKVKTLVNEVIPAGEHSVLWNGRDTNGNQVSSGIYFYKLKTANFEKTRKMILLK